MSLNRKSTCTPGFLDAPALAVQEGAPDAPKTVFRSSLPREPLGFNLAKRARVHSSSCMLTFSIRIVYRATVETRRKRLSSCLSFEKFRCKVTTETQTFGPGTHLIGQWRKTKLLVDPADDIVTSIKKRTNLRNSTLFSYWELFFCLFPFHWYSEIWWIIRRYLVLKCYSMTMIRETCRLLWWMEFHFMISFIFFFYYYSFLSKNTLW